MEPQYLAPWVYVRLDCKEHKGMCYEYRIGNRITTVHDEKIVPIEELLHHGR